MSVQLTLTALGSGLALLYLGADALVRGSSRLALRSGLTPLTVGLTVVAFGTSSPELVVSLEAAIQGRDPIAVGNVIGSNIANIGLILGLAALIRPMMIQSQLCRLDLPILAGCSALLTLLLLDLAIGRLEGALLVIGLVVYNIVNVRNARREQEAVRKEYEGALPKSQARIWVDVTLVVLGLIMLIGGGNALILGATEAARFFNLTDAVIGLTLVAIGTSLPELATSVVGALRGEGDIVLGNLIGSNVFNILGVIGPATLIHPMQAPGVTLFDISAMTLIAFLVLPLMRTGFRLSRLEGALLVAVYGGYMYLLLR